MRTIMIFMNEKFQEMKVSFQAVSSYNVELRKKNAELKRESVDFRNTVRKKETRIAHCERFNRRYNLESKAIP